MLYLSNVVGVTIVETNVEAKSVVVMHDDTVDKMVLDEKLQKVCILFGIFVLLFVANSLKMGLIVLII